MHDWQNVYAVEPFANSSTSAAALSRAVLGGEVCAWAPYNDGTNFLSQVFPRAAAAAERLWSARGATQDALAAEPRLHAWRCALLRRGIATPPVGGFADSYCVDGPVHFEYRPPY